jgi:hypothetical protein
MNNGYEFELSDGVVLQLVPNAGIERCSIAHGDVKIEVEIETGAFTVAGAKGISISSLPAVVRFSRKSFQVENVVQMSDAGEGDVHAMRNCMPCNGRWCCVSGGCGNCGCGWICG